MYNEEKLYSVISLVVVQILNFQRDLVVVRFVRIELIICSTNKADRAKVHVHVKVHIHVVLRLYPLCYTCVITAYGV